MSVPHFGIASDAKPAAGGAQVPADVGPDGYPRYKWRGTHPGHADNVGLRRVMELAKPLAG
jgi:hypothetical protein